MPAMARIKIRFDQPESGGFGEYWFDGFPIRQALHNSESCAESLA
jgi:hypothetical protein